MSLNWNEIKSRALLFSKTWADASNEDSEAKPFWIAFFEIFGITDKRVATFELNVKKLGGAQGYVDLFWPGVLLVEHKSRGKNLDDAVDQAVGYLHNLPERDLPQLVVVCDFARFRVRILATGETVEFELKHLHKHVKLFGLLAGYKVQDIRAEDPVNIKAAERMGRLHDALKASGYEGHALEVLLVRLLFCLFADDTGIFQPAQSFRDFVEERTAPDGSDLGPRLSQLFQVLNTHEASRNKHIDEQLNKFAYINGKLFEETLPMADFSTAMREALLDACALDWSAISPAIFGSLFQSIMDDKARRNLGAHYTSEANILKLIKPLFLDELHTEFERIKGNRHKLVEFHSKLKSLTFFDPACGCGNFLVISYRELRELELQVLRADNELSAHKGQLSVDVNNLIGVNVDQFYGIEIEEFPAQIAQVALWLVDHQMNLRVSVEFGLYFARIPLKSTPHIQHGNALRLDWNEVLPAQRCSYVLGNPPFIGHQWRTVEQAADMDYVWGDGGKFGRLDFVTCWHKKSVDYMKGNTSCSAAFVSDLPPTNLEPDLLLLNGMANGGRSHQPSISINLEPDLLLLNGMANGGRSLLLDELDASLHPSMIKNMLDVIKSVFLRNNVKVILVTHSPTTIALCPEESIYVMNREGNNRIEKKDRSSALSILTEGFATLDDGILLFSQIENNKLNIVTEGNNISYLYKSLEFAGLVNQVTIIKGLESMTGKSQLKTLFDFFSRVEHKNNVFFVLDCDANDVAKKLQDGNKTYSFIFEENAENKLTNKGIENLFPEHLFQGFLTTVTSSTGSVTEYFDNSRKPDFENHVLKTSKAEDFSKFQLFINKVRELSE